ncbi:MAG: glycosyltransferase family 4 protein [Pseudomonadota bacterium]
MNILFVYPGDINLPTGGYRYDRSILAGWREAGINVESIGLVGEYPFPSEQEKQFAMDKLGNCSQFDIAVVDGLAGGAHPELIAMLAAQMPVVLLVHHPLCLETGISQKHARMLETTETQSLAKVDAVVTTSETTANTVQSMFGFAGKDTHSVLPGVDRGTRSNPKKQGPIELLCVGSIIARKGHADLVSALAVNQNLDWSLTCVGKTDLDADLFHSLRKQVEALVLEDRVAFTGALDEAGLETKYNRAHVFVLPSHYEGYGMAYSEAIVRGIPVIGTTAGAISKTVPPACGILVEPGNVSQLSDAIKTMILDRDRLAEYRSACLVAEATFPTWRASADQFAKILKEYI